MNWFYRQDITSPDNISQEIRERLKHENMQPSEELVGEIINVCKAYHPRLTTDDNRSPFPRLAEKVLST